MVRRFIPASAGNTAGGAVSGPAHRRFIPASAGNTPCAISDRQTHERFIPASAGNTLQSICVDQQLEPVHPRERGEHWRLTAAMTASAVHPRERGEHAMSVRPIGRDCRFIPASAGNTRAFLRQIPTAVGSSPRARGTLTAHDLASGRDRFIPASAGNTIASALRGQAHHGSSPRARGTRDSHGCQWRVIRFIPASAGNTSRDRTSASVRPVHPRERGEHPLIERLRRELRRFIPASAGNTVQAEALRPRFAGSSPRARGTLAHGCQRR